MIERWNRHKGGCIYCGRPGPFSAEHVVCAGLGGDDKAWMLEGCVCQQCNTVVFSKQEAKFLKQSSISLARLYLQPRTRDKKRPPSLDTEATLMLSPDNRWTVAELRAGGEPMSVPQVCLYATDAHDEYYTVAPDREALERLQTTLQDLWETDFDLIVKYNSKEFGVVPLMWHDDHFVIGEEHAVDRPPKRGVWMAPLTSPPNGPANAVVPMSLYLRSEGQLVCTSLGVRHAAAFLSRIRVERSRVFPTEWPLPTKVEGPQMFLRLREDISATRRVQAKIGLNLLAFLVGPKFMRQASFDLTVDYVLGNKDWGFRGGHAPIIELGPPLEDHHVFLVVAQRAKRLGPWHISSISQLYGGVAFVTQLGWSQTCPAALREPVAVQVDYTKNKIRRRSLYEHAADLMRVEL